jgi:hypothetical protein
MPVWKSRKALAMVCALVQAHRSHQRAQAAASLHKFTIRRKAAEDSRTPRRYRVFRHAAPSARSWRVLSASVKYLFRLIHKAWG